MQGSESFKQIINTYLQTLSLTDLAFAEVFKKETKNIDDCETYILTEVKKTQQIGFADDEVYKMAVDYYNDDTIEIKPLEGGGRIVVNQHIPYVKPQPTHSQVFKSKTTTNKPQPASQTSLF